MPERPLSNSHLGTLWTIHNKGNQPSQKSDVAVLLKRGLVEPVGARGQYGMTHYRNTPAGREMAQRITLDKGKFSLGEPSVSAPAPTESGEVPPGHMKLRNGQVVRIANRSE